MSEDTTDAPLYRLQSDPSKPPASRDDWIADLARNPGWTMDSAIALFDRMRRAGTLQEVHQHG